VRNRVGSIAHDVPPVRGRATDGLIAPWWELAGLGALVFVLYAAREFADATAVPVLNIIAPVTIAAILAASALHMVRVERIAVWTSLFWFRIATATYFGFGSLVPEISNYTTQDHVERFYKWTPEELYKLNLIVAFSAFLLIGSSLLLLRLWERTSVNVSAAAGAATLFRLGAVFAVIGYSIRLLIVVPMSTGTISDGTVPGSLLTLNLLAPLGIYMLTLYAIRANSALLPFIAGLLAFDILLGLLLFSKSDIVIASIMFSLAWLTDRITFARLAMTGAGVFAIYSVLPAITDYGRLEIFQRYGSLHQGGLEERLEIIFDYWKSELPMAIEEPLQSTLSRLSYVNAATFAINLYDRGLGGLSMQNIFAVFVPRVLWADKPIITQIGVDFNVLATGNPRSSSAPGIFADAYWGYGWLGVIILMSGAGLLLGALSRYAQSVQLQQRWIHFPLVLYAMRIGTRVDGFVVVDLVGPMVIFLGMLPILFVFEKLFDVRGPAKQAALVRAIERRLEQ
jgi:hypothetical protein